MMCSYRREAEKETRELTDYWNTEDFKEKRQRPDLFNDQHQRDLALMLTTDELSPYKSKAYYRVTPIVLACYNLPPHIRFKMRFLLVAGFIPGRNRSEDCPKGVAKPQDKESYFEPLIRELEQLRNGVRCYDAVERKDFKLSAYLVVIASDMVERADLLGLFNPFIKLPFESCTFWTCITTRSTTHVYVLTLL